MKKEKKEKNFLKKKRRKNPKKERRNYQKIISIIRIFKVKQIWDKKKKKRLWINSATLKKEIKRNQNKKKNA